MLRDHRLSENGTVAGYLQPPLQHSENAGDSPALQQVQRAAFVCEVVRGRRNADAIRIKP